MDNIKEKIQEIVYKRQVFYYETDQMGIVHHSNYIRWFEESRVYFLEQIGFGYDKMESHGILSPVLGVTCEYKSSVHFHDIIEVCPILIFFSGVKMTIRYEVRDAVTKEIRAIGESKHGFVSSDFKPVRMKKDFPEIFHLLSQCVVAN